jgi:molecular chaperone GrpE
MNEHNHTPDPVDDAAVDNENENLDNTTTEDKIEDEKDSKTGKHGKKDSKKGEKIKELEIEVAELKDKYLRLYAEFDNYKRRTVKEKLDMMRTAAQDTLTSMLPILDDFDRAKKISDDPATSENFPAGVELVYQKLYSTLKNLGLQEMESNGQSFDPGQHEAITEITATTEELKGKVVDTVEKGYYLHDKIIRHAKVVTGK